MKTVKFLLISFFLISLSLFSLDSLGQDSTKIIIGNKYRMHSKILNEDRAYWVSLPWFYNNTQLHTKKYPVLILLDGDREFNFANATIEFLNANRRIPDMIVVGIPNTDRARDLTPSHSCKKNEGKEEDWCKTTGGGEDFLRFIHEELLRVIDSSFRTLSYRILVGHSAGGNLAIYSFLGEKKAFNNYIAMDPYVLWDDQFVTRKLRIDSTIKKNYKSSLYISVAHNTFTPIDTSAQRKAIDEFCSTLKANSLPTLNFKAQYFEEEDHGSIPLISLYHGLLFSFEGYHLSNPNDKDVTEIKEHYEKFSRKLNFQFLPPEEIINDLGYYHLYTTKDLDKAMRFFAFNTLIHSESTNVYNAQAEAYKVMGNTKKAIEYYNKSLQKDPNNKRSFSKLQELKDGQLK